MKQFCAQCEKWYNTEGQFCPKCATQMIGEGKYAQILENISNNTTRYKIENYPPEDNEYPMDIEEQDYDNISLQNELLEEILNLNKKQLAKQSKIYDDLHFIKTVVKTSLILGGIALAIYLISLTF